MAIFLCLCFLRIPNIFVNFWGLGSTGNPIRTGPNTQLKALYEGISRIM